MTIKPLLVNLSLACSICLCLFLAINTSGGEKVHLYYFSSISFLVGLILYQFFSCYQKTLILAYNRYLIFLILFIIWATLSIFWSPVFSSSLSAVTLIYFFPIGVILGFWSNQQQQGFFYNLLILLLLVITWKSVQQNLFSTPTLQALGFFSNKNTNGIFMCMILLPLCAQCLKQSTAAYTQYMLAIALFLGAFTVALSTSRGATLGLSIGVLLLLTHTLYHKLSLVPFLKMSAYLCAGYFSTELIAGTNNWQRLAESTTAGNVAALANGRDFLWQSGWEMYLDRPLFGWGFNMFNWLFPQYRHAPDMGLYAHNDYLQFLIELGPVGLLLFVGFLISFFMSCKKLYILSSAQHDKLESLGLIAACIALFIHSFFSFNLYQSGPLLLLGLYIGVLTQQLNKLAPEKNIHWQASSSQFSSASGYYGVLSVLAILLCLMAGLQVFGLEKLEKTYPNNIAFLQESEKAHTLLPYEEHILAIQLSLYQQLLSDTTLNLSLENQRFLVKNGLRVSNEAIDKNPYRASNYTHKADFYTLTSAASHPERLQKIKLAYTQAIKVNPFSLRIRVNYANVLIKQGEIDQAIQIYKEGLNKKYYGAFQDPIYYLNSLLNILLTTERQKAITNIKQQIVALQKQAENRQRGTYTLKSW
ncbi:MAG: hypothetical protein GQ582_07735 [Methyloprofundus sp.]|nr:hypothetical protein [Methyloprofundus sp.]